MDFISLMGLESSSDNLYSDRARSTFLRATIFSAKGGSPTNSNISLTPVPALVATQVCTL